MHTYKKMQKIQKMYVTAINVYEVAATIMYYKAMQVNIELLLAYETRCLN